MNVSYDFSLPAYQALTFTDDFTPFAQPRKASVGHVTKGTSARAATVTTVNSNRRAVPLSSKHVQAVRVAPTPMAGSTKKSQQITPPTRPATATGRMASTRIGSVSTRRIQARPATSVSSRPPATVARTGRSSTKSQTGTTLLASDFEIVLEFEGLDSDVGNDDFMFDV